MKYKDTGFRAIYHHFCVVEMNGQLKELAKELPEAGEANGVMTYGYYDREAGLTLEILAAAKIDNKGFMSGPCNPSVSLKLRVEALGDTEFFVADDSDGTFAKKYADKLEMLEGYSASEEVEMTRGWVFLDNSRDPFFIDDVSVNLVKIGLDIEKCWVRITHLEERNIIGTLLNEPYQDFGWQKGDEIAFFVHKTEEGNIVCISDMIPSKMIRREDLEDGSMLKDSIVRFNEDRSEKNFIDVLEILRDSYVWVPCNAILSDADNGKLEDMIKECEGDLDKMLDQTFIVNDCIRFIPDILQNGDDFFFPVFSSDDEMGDYGNGFSKVARHILDVIPLARNNEKNVKGIVINAFSGPFILDAELFHIIEEMESRLLEDL